jgi:quercetin dioxygenase-like cupin family protein
MKSLRPFLVTAVAAFAATFVLTIPAVAQSQQLDSTIADPQHHKVVLENDEVRVVRYVIPPGDTTAKHSHPNFVAVYLTDANAKVTTDDGKTSEVHAKAGTATWRTPTTHVFQNIGDKPIEGIAVEPKSPHSAPPAGSVDETNLPGAGAKIVFENEQVRVVHYTIQPGQKVPMHGHPDNVQIPLTDATAESTGPDNKTTAVSLKAGEVRWRPAFQHSVVNTGSTPIEGVLVEMKGAPATK